MGRFADILAEVKQLKKSGNLQKLPSHKITLHTVKDYTPNEIKEIRQKANMTQSMFAICLGVTPKSIEAWEGGRSTPNGSARRLLQFFAQNPKFAEDNNILVVEYINHP